MAWTHGLTGRGLALDGVQKADELLMSVARHAASYDLGLQHIEPLAGCVREAGAVALPGRPLGPTALTRPILRRRRTGVGRGFPRLAHDRLQLRDRRRHTLHH
jgi:hypothetical protein